jgi:OOP family OmpA-OmpF porin
MHVDLGNFYYLSAHRTGQGDEDATHIALTLSAGGQNGYVHLATVSPLPPAASMASLSDQSVLSTRSPALANPTGADVIDQLHHMGRAPLDDLHFATGTSTLSDSYYDSLTALAAFLADRPDARVVLVGHSDWQGSLPANIRISRARARAVMQFMIAELGTNPAQISAQGVGYLAPLGANDTDEGRTANRRVEVVLTQEAG